MTKKEFVLNVVEQLATDAKAVLSGHRLPPDILNIIQQRADIQSKLAATLLSMKSGSQGSKGLRKTSNFQIKGYDSFGMFNINARKDIQDFMDQLSPEDQLEFTNKDSIVVIVAQPDEHILVETKEQIVTGPTVIIPFEKAIRSEQKTIGGKYIMIMIGKSAARTEKWKAPKAKPSASEVADQKAALAEKRRLKKEKLLARREKESARRAKRALRRDNKRTRAAEESLNRGFDRNMSSVEKQRLRLAREQQLLRGEVSQFDKLVGLFGPNVSKGIKMTDKAYNEFLKDLKKYEPILSNPDKVIINKYLKLMNKGQESEAKSELKNLSNRKLAVMISRGLPESSVRILEREKAPLYSQLEKLRTKIPAIMELISSAETPRAKANAKSKLAEINHRIRVIRAKLGTYDEMSSKAIAKKAKMLSQTQAALEANLRKGADLKSALQAALGSLRTVATPAETNVIKQQIAAQLQQGVPVQYAVQQAIQSLPVAQPKRRGRTTKETSVSDLIASGIL